MSRIYDRRLGAIESAVGIRRRPAPDDHKAKVLDDWFLAVTGRRLAQMSDDEINRLERLFRSLEIIGDDAADQVLACMDENQTVVDLERWRQQQMDRGP